MEKVKVRTDSRKDFSALQSIVKFCIIFVACIVFLEKKQIEKNFTYFYIKQLHK